MKKETIKAEMTSDFISIGNLMCSLGSVGRSDGLNTVLITDTYMKTYGNGIFAKYSYKSLGFDEGFVPIDSKMFFSREVGEYNFIFSKEDSAIEIKGKGRKSNIPFISYQEYNSIEEFDENLEFKCPGDILMEKLTSSDDDNTILKVKLSKDDINKIKAYQSYLGHKTNEECFKITKNPDNTNEIIIKIEDNSISSSGSRKNKRTEELILSEKAIEINNLTNTELTAIYTPKYMPTDDYMMTIYKVESSQKSGTYKNFMKFEGCLLDVIYYTLANEEVVEHEETKEEVKAVKKKVTKETVKEVKEVVKEEVKVETKDEDSIDDLLNDELLEEITAKNDSLEDDFVDILED